MQGRGENIKQLGGKYVKKKNKKNPNKQTNPKPFLHTAIGNLIQG
jgi:hypothetical protein